MAKKCVAHGTRVQNSVFECVLDSTQLKMLRHELEQTIDPTCDSLRFYTLGNHYQNKVTHIGAKVGLVPPERLAAVEEKYEAVRREIARLEGTGIAANDRLNEMLAARDSAPVTNSARLADLLRRPQVSYEDIAPFDPDRPELPAAVTEEVQIQLKYAGYLQRQLRQVEEFKKEEARLLPESIDYHAIAGLRLEAKEKLSAIRPMSIGQAGRISGVSPADIAVLLIWLEQNK